MLMAELRLVARSNISGLLGFDFVSERARRDQRTKPLFNMARQRIKANDNVATVDSDALWAELDALESVAA